MDQRVKIHPLPPKPLDERGRRLLSRAADAYVKLTRLSDRRNEINPADAPEEFGSVQFYRGVEYGLLEQLLERLAEEFPYSPKELSVVNQNRWRQAIQDSPTVREELRTPVPS